VDTPAKRDRLTRFHEENPRDVDAAADLMRDLIRINLRDEALKILRNMRDEGGAELENSVLEKFPELEGFKLKMGIDYRDSVDILREFGVLAEGETSYQSDVEGLDVDENGKPQRFEMPTMAEVMSWLTEKDLALYQSMEKEGLEPKLQLTPIGRSIRSLGSAIDQHLTMEGQEETYIWNGINDEELIYEPEGYDASNPNQLVKIGGMSKKEWVLKNKGWLVEIVATKQDLEADPAIQKDPQGQVRTVAQQTALYADKLKQEGRKGLTFESYLAAQMRALKNQKPLEDDFWTVALDSAIADNSLVSYSDWHGDRVFLAGDGANVQFSYLRVRPSGRVNPS